MSLPFGFSPFDDYDSPYATTNAAIRRQSRTLQGQTTPGHITPTSSFQQQQHQGAQRGPTQPSSGATSHSLDPLPRRSSPPPPIPAAEDFGSSRRYSASRAPSMDSQGVRHIAKPIPLGAPWADSGTSSPPLRSAPLARSPSASPQSKSSESPPANTNLGASSPHSRRAPPPPPTSRSTASLQKLFTKPAQSPSMPSQRQALPAPVPIMASLPEPAAPPAASQVALATPADVDTSAASPSQSSDPSAQEVREVDSVDSQEDENEDDESRQMMSPLTSDDELDQPITSFRTPTEEEEVPVTEDVEGGQSTHRSGGNAAGAAAGAGAGIAALGTADVVSSDTSSVNMFARHARDDPEAAPHTSYNLGSPGAFDEKHRSDDQTPLAGGLGAGAATAAASHSYKAFNEKSRGGWSNSPGDGPAAGGAGVGAAFARSWRSHKKRWIIGIVLLLAILAAAIGGGVAGKAGSSSSDSDDSDGSDSGNGTSGSTGSSTGSQGIGPLDSRLSKSFYGLNYNPLNSSVTSDCGCNITGVIHDITILSQLTSRVRLLGSACNQTALVLDAIERLGVDMQVWPGVILTSSMTITSTSFTEQLANLTFAFDNYGTSKIGGVYVGDEYVTSMGSPTSLERFLTATRDTISDNPAWGTVLVGSAETASTWSVSLAEKVDFVFANDESWDSSLTGAEGAAYSYDTFETNVVDVIADATNAPKAYISAIGWPTATSSGTTTTLDSVTNLQSLLDAYVCDANTNGTGYFWFELYDDLQSDIEATGGEATDSGLAGYWGLFDSSRNLKSLTLPACSLS